MLTDERLSAIMQMLPDDANIIADIGTDHGRLGAQLLLNDRCKMLWFSDISAPSLEKAKRLTEKIGLSERSRFYLGDGASAFEHAPDAAVIAGMGGITISEILKGAGEKLKGTRLVLQPNVAIYELRCALSDLGYRITDEKCVIAARRKYILISAQEGSAACSYKELAAGPVLTRTMTSEFEEYARFRERVITKALKGALSSESADTDALERELSVWKEILDEYDRKKHS